MKVTTQLKWSMIGGMTEYKMHKLLSHHYNQIPGIKKKVYVAYSLKIQIQGQVAHWFCL